MLKQKISFKVIPLKTDRSNMNDRKIKLALTVGLLNREPGQENILQLVKRLLVKFRTETGSYLGLRQLGHQIISGQHTLKSYALDFDCYTLNLDIVSNASDNTESINRLEFESLVTAYAA